jgi:hypothetical protein
MARKILVSTSNTVAVWVQKTNVMSDYMGDLNDLSSVFDSDLGNALFPDQDSNFVSSLNHLAWLGPTIDAALLGINPPPGSRHTSQNPITVTARIVADSANFEKITLSKLENTDAAMLVFDDASFFGDSNPVIGGLHFDFNADSARFGYITVHDSNNLDALSADSIQIGNILIGGTGKISRLFSDDSSTIKIINARILTTPDTQTFDSVLVTNRIHIDNFFSQAGGDSGVHIDSAYIDTLNLPDWDASALGNDSARIRTISADQGSFNKVEVNQIFDAERVSINRLIMDDTIIDSIAPFLFGDSTGTSIFAAYTLQESG